MCSLEIIIFDEEDLTKTLIENYLKESEFDFELKQYNEFNPNVIENDENFKILIINISNTDDNIFDKIAACSDNRFVKIIAMSYDGGANLQVKAFRAGAKDFILKPLIKSDFINTVKSVYEKYYYKNIKNIQGKIFMAVSNRKGDGKSVFLLNLAKEIADFSKRKVLLLDFNNSQDNISFLLNADIVHNTNYYINNLTEDNAQALLATLTKYKSSSLYIMANSFLKSKSISIKCENLYEFFNILKHHFDYIFIDKTPEENQINDDILINISEEIFCIVLPFISSSDKIKDILENYSKNKKIRIILNQYTVEDKFRIEQIQASLGHEIFWKIPKNYTALNTALNNNVTLKEAAEYTDISNAYVELARYLVNRD